MIGDHQRASHSDSRRGDAVAVLVEQAGVGLVPDGPLPAGGLVEDGAPLALALVERWDPYAAVGLPLLGGVDDPVHLVEALAGAGKHMRAGLLRRVGARNVGLEDVDLRLAVDHQLGDGLAGARALLDPDRRGRPQAPDLRGLAQQRQAVVGHGQQAVDRVLHADGLVADDLRHQLERDLHLRVEVVLREGQLGRGQRRLLDRGDLLGVHHDRAVGVGADLEPGSLLALVHVGVDVAHDRVLDHPLGVGEARHRTDVDHLVHRRG